VLCEKTLIVLASYGFERGQDRESKRKQVRYGVSDDCRIRASIKVRSADAATASKDWTGTLVDMSSGGAHIQISLGAVAYTGDTCVLTLAPRGGEDGAARHARPLRLLGAALGVWGEVRHLLLRLGQGVSAVFQGHRREFDAERRHE
jgi:hypothetical protein